ncbi:MAG: hypothetical protein WBW06_07555 [Xanthobacteraceae bacterium]
MSNNVTGREPGDAAKVDATATAIEEWVVQSVRHAYEALTALGYSHDHAERELVHTCRDAIDELPKKPGDGR